MKKLIIYLSISKASSPQLHSKVIDLFKKLEEVYDFELRYFKGGIYTGKELRGSDILFIIPPTSDYLVPRLSKGNYTEADYMIVSNKPVYLINEDLSLVKIRGLDTYKGPEANWQTDYGYIIPDSKSYIGEISSVISILGETLGKDFKKTVSAKEYPKNSNQLLLLTYKT